MTENMNRSNAAMIQIVARQMARVNMPRRQLIEQARLSPNHILLSWRNRMRRFCDCDRYSYINRLAETQTRSRL